MAYVQWHEEKGGQVGGLNKTDSAIDHGGPTAKNNSRNEGGKEGFHKHSSQNYICGSEQKEIQYLYAFPTTEKTFTSSMYL